MKRIIISILATVMVAAVAAWNVNLNPKKGGIGDLILAGTEVLAKNEGGLISCYTKTTLIRQYSVPCGDFSCIIYEYSLSCEGTGPGGCAEGSMTVWFPPGGGGPDVLSDNTKTGTCFKN